jgi:hypothetical protein
MAGKTIYSLKINDGSNEFSWTLDYHGGSRDLSLPLEQQIIRSLKLIVAEREMRLAEITKAQREMVV